MPYIGKQLVRGQNRKLDDISSGFNGSQTTFTLQIASQNVSVGSALQLWISVGGVIQNPLTDFTIAGNQITFTTAPAASLDFFGVIQGDVTDTNTPGDATVTTSKLATGLTVNLADGSAATSSLQLGGTDSGLFSSAADKVNVTTGGVERLEIGNSEVVFNDGSNDVDFRVESNGNTHMLFVDGGNDVVGIGTSSPVAGLTVAKQGTVLSGTSNSFGFSINPQSNGYVYLDAVNSGSSNTSLSLRTYNNGTYTQVIQSISGNATTFETAGSERARLDSSGRLLVGTSSSRDSGNINQPYIQREGTSVSTSTLAIVRNSNDSGPSVVALSKSRGTSVGSNTLVQNGDALGAIYFSGADGSDLNSVGALIQAEVDGGPGTNDMPGRLVFSTSADGTSSPTERLRIDSSGHVGIGNTSMSSFSALNANNLVVGSGSGTEGLTIYSGSSNSGNIAFADGTSGSAAYRGIVNYNHSVDAMTLQTAATERMRIDSSGRLLVGTTTASSAGVAQYSRLEVAGNTSNATGSAGLTLKNGTAAASLSSNNVLGSILFSGLTGGDFANIEGRVDGTPTGSAFPGRLQFSTTASGASSPTERMRISQNGGINTFSASDHYFAVRNNGTSSSLNAFIVFQGATATTNGTPVMVVRQDGDLENANNNYGSLSDVKLKENIVDAGSQWNDLKTLQVRKYNFKAETGYSTHTQIGLIAQEIELVSPGLVSESPDQDGEGNDLGTTTKSVSYSVLYMKAIKALQEAMTRIETLEARVTTLEAG